MKKIVKTFLWSVLILLFGASARAQVDPLEQGAFTRFPTKVMRPTLPSTSISSVSGTGGFQKVSRISI